MKMTKQKREIIAASQKVAAAIIARPKLGSDKVSGSKVDLTKIASDLAERRAAILRGQKDDK